MALRRATVYPNGIKPLKRKDNMTKTLLFAGALVLAVTPALAAKDCEELKAEIAAKIEKKGVKAYTLEVVKKGEEGERRVVGTCGGGASVIVYKRGKAS